MDSDPNKETVPAHKLIAKEPMSSTRVIVVMPLIGLTMYMAYAGIVRGRLLAWGDAAPDWWYGHSATLGGFGWLCLAGFLTTALVPTKRTARTLPLIVAGRISLALFFVLEIISALIAQQ